MQLTNEYIAQKFNEITDYLKSRRAELVAASGNVDSVSKKDEYQTILTKFDGEIESAIREILKDEVFNLGICGEEHGTSGDTSNFWTVDPIDGTEHFVRGDPFYMCLIGLVTDDIPQAALLYNYPLDQLFISLPGEEPTCNGSVIRVSDREMSRSAVQFESKDVSSEKSFVNHLISNSYIPQAFGACAGFGLTQVARGASDARVQIDGYGYLWDYLPGLILIKAAGGIVRNPGSDMWDWHNLDSIASNAVIADEVHQVVLSSKA